MVAASVPLDDFRGDRSSWNWVLKDVSSIFNSVKLVLQIISCHMLRSVSRYSVMKLQMRLLISLVFC